MPLLVFDIDGTLTDTNRVDGTCYLAALDAAWPGLTHRARAGDYAHVTDEGILAETLVDSGVAWDDAVVARCKDDFVARMAAVFADDPCVPMTGIPAFLGWLDERGIPWCAATGAWFASGRLKLDVAGIALDDELLVASDGVPAKRDILTQARAAAVACFDLPDDTTTLYLGDRPYDLAAARILDWGFVGVGDRIRETCEDANVVWIADFEQGRFALEQLLDPAGKPAGRGRKDTTR